MGLFVDVTVFRANPALKVAFEHDRGILVLYGRSGAGKTTVLQVISGAIRPDSGQIRLDDQILFRDRPHLQVPIHKRSVAHIFQHGNLFPHMTVRDNVDYAARDRTIADQWIRRFDLLELARRFPRQLSGGEQQRVALVRALASRPKLLLLDEPLSAVDAGYRMALLDELLGVQRTVGTPMIFVTHSVAEASRIADRVLLLDHGRIVADGPPLEVLHGPASAPILQLSGEENVLTGTVVHHDREDGTSDVAVGSTFLHVPYCGVGIGEPVTLAVRPEDILVSLSELRDSSARNQLPGTVLEVQSGIPGSVIIDAALGFRVRARVTIRSMTTLGLIPGRRVFVIIKAWSFHLVDSRWGVGDLNSDRNPG